MSPPTRHNNLLYFSFFWLFLGSFFVRSQLNVPPTLETNSGTGSEIIHCTTDPLIFTLQVSPTSSNSVLKYQYIRDRGSVNSNLTGLTVSTTINQSLTALQDGDIVFAEIYLENNNGVFQKISETNTLTIRLVDPPEVIITHDGQITTVGEVFCLGTPTTITVAPSGFQPGTNAYEFYVDNVLHQGPSAQNIFTYTFSRNSSLTIRVNNACVYERTLAFKGNGVNPGSIVVSHTQIVSVVPATHNGYVSNNATITYGWESSFDNITWSPVLSAQASSLTFLPFGVVVYYRRVGISNVATATCRDVSNIVVITPQEQIIQNNQKVCENEAFLELTVSEVSPATIQSYQWQASGDGGLNFADIPLATQASYQPPNSTTTTQYRRLTTHTGGYVSTSTVFIAAINDLDPGSLDLAQNETICYNTLPSLIGSGPTGIDPSSTNGTVGYQWQQSLDNANWENILTASNIDYQANTLTQTTYFRRLALAAADASTCEKPSNSIVINQSTQLDTKYVFGSLSFDELKFSLGFDINSFRVAESGLTMNDFQLTYVYKIQVQNDLFLLPSVTMGFSQSKLETQNLIFGDQLNAVSGFFSTETLDPLLDLQGAISYFDFTASLLLHNNQYMVGMSFQHLNRPNKSFNNELSNPLPIHYEILGGYEFNLNPFENNLLPGYSYLFAFASLGLLQNQKFLYTAQEAQLGAFSVGINQKTILNNGFSFNNIGFSLGMSVENFDFGLFYQLPSKTKKLSTPSIFELQVTFNFSKYRRNNRGFYKRLQTDNYF